MMAASSWRRVLRERLPLMGHRNWIVVADGAYPWQTSPGIETVCTGTEPIAVLKTVLEAVHRAPHVRPLIYLDAELSTLDEKHAPGIAAYRRKCAALLDQQGGEWQELPHEKIIHRLDKTSRLFGVLILKTTLTLPYTSVFLELACGYWSETAEQARLQGVK